MREIELPDKAGMYFPPEWAPQDGIMLTWPHEKPIGQKIGEVEITYTEIAKSGREGKIGGGMS